jgi:hypothetical protein
MGAAMTGTGPALNIPAMSIRVLQLFAALAFGKAALRLSRGEGLPQTIGFAPLPSPRPKGPAADMIKVVLSVSLLAMSGMILGHILDLWGAADFLNHQYELDTGMLAGIGARVGAIIGVISSKVSWKERYTVVVGLSAELLFFDWFLDPWIGLPLLLILVAITALWSSQKADANTGEKKTSTWQALRTAWIFVFYGILGGVAGQIIGLVFLGPAGMVVGELLGGSILATTALLILRSENTAQQKKSLQTHRSHKT